MQKYSMRPFDLQLFADGASAGGGEGGGASTTGEGSPAAAGQTANTAAKTLEDLGVPKAKAERYRARKVNSAVQEAKQEAAQEPDTVQAGTETTPQNTQNAADGQAAAANAITWEMAIKDPEINKKLQEIITARTKNLREAMKDLAPALDILGPLYGLDLTDMSKADYKAFSKAVTEDDRLYEKKAVELGVDVPTAKRIENLEADKRRNAAENARREQAEVLGRHYDQLQQQGAKLKEEFPSFDLDAELQNEVFYRLTLPGSGLNVEQAYWAVHHKEISEAKKAETARFVSSAISNAVRSGQQMPQENGTNMKVSAGVASKLYSQMNPEERQAYKAELQRQNRRY